MFHVLPPLHRSCGTTGATGSEIDHELDVTDVIRIQPGPDRCSSSVFAAGMIRGHEDVEKLPNRVREVLTYVWTGELADASIVDSPLTRGLLSTLQRELAKQPIRSGLRHLASTHLRCS